jgi:hypothetical protein
MMFHVSALRLVDVERGHAESRGLVPFGFCRTCGQHVPVDYEILDDGWRSWCPQCEHRLSLAGLYWLDKFGWEAVGWRLDAPAAPPSLVV